jgi:hypothetical protein
MITRRRGRQPTPGLREAAIPHAQRSDDRRLEAAGVQQSAQDLARARLAERPREADDREIAGGIPVQSRREEGKRAAGRGDDKGRHARRHTVGPLDRHSRSAEPDGLLDERMPVVHRTLDRDEQRAGCDAPAVFRHGGDLRIRIESACICVDLRLDLRLKGGGQSREAHEPILGERRET